MKWKNKDHEFDSMYKIYQRRIKFDFFGAGAYRRQFIKVYPKEFEVIGFIYNQRKSRLQNSTDTFTIIQSRPSL